MTSLRRDTFHRVQELSFSYFDKTNSGWLIARMNNDTSSIGDVLSWDIISMFWALFDLFFTLITMFTNNWLLSLVVCASIPVVAIIIPLFERSLLKKWRTARNAYSRFVGWLAEAINGSEDHQDPLDRRGDFGRGENHRSRHSGQTLESRQDQRSLPAARLLHLDDHDRHRRRGRHRDDPPAADQRGNRRDDRHHRSFHLLRRPDLRSASVDVGDLQRLHGLASRRRKGRPAPRCQSRDRRYARSHRQIWRSLPSEERSLRESCGAKSSTTKSPSIMAMASKSSTR
jgi:hypothetical protein